MKTLSVVTKSGKKITLSPVPMSHMPSSNPSSWLAFQGPHLADTALDDLTMERIQRFMRENKTEALSTGTDIVTLAGGMLALCDAAAHNLDHYELAFSVGE